MSLQLTGGMVHVNCKKGSAVDTSGPLRKYIAENYSDREAEDVREDLETLMELRTAVTDNGNSSESQKEAYLRYWRQLGAIEARFPISNQKEHITCNFVWYDAFKSNRKCQQSNVHLEKAAVMFNIGATNAQLGASADRSSAEGIKLAAHRLQEAAGAFSHLREHVLPKLYTGATVDLSSEACTMLEKLMLAQAQEVFLEKAVADGKSAAICGKLAEQAGVFYDEVAKIAAQPPLSGHLDKGWGMHASLKAGMCHADALRHVARGLHDAEEIGQEIARLQVATHVLQTAVKGVKPNDCPLVRGDEVKNLTAQMDRALKRAHKENENVYLMKVPSADSLPYVTGAAMVKPAAPQGMEGQPGEALFACIIPEGSTRALSRYTEMVDQLIREESDKLQSCSDDARLRLREFELPDVLYALEGGVTASPIGVPEPVKQVLEELESRGGLGFMQEMQDQCTQLKSVCVEVLDAADADLSNEEESERKMLERFQDRWTRPQSQSLNRGLWEKSKSLRSSLQAAAASDARVNDRLQQCEHALGILTVDNVVSMMPRLKAPMVEVGGNEAAVAVTLRNLVEELERVAAQRAGLEEMLKSMKQQDDILPRLMSSSEDPDTLFRKELGKYDPVRAEVARNVDAQRSLLGQIADAYRVFRSAYQLDEWRASCERTSHEIMGHVQVYREIRDGLGEGLKYYSSVQEAAVRLRQQCGDLCSARRMQRDEMLEDMQRQMQEQLNHEQAREIASQQAAEAQARAAQAHAEAHAEAVRAEASRQENSRLQAEAQARAAHEAAEAQRQHAEAQRHEAQRAHAEATSAALAAQMAHQASLNAQQPPPPPPPPPQQPQPAPAQPQYPPPPAYHAPPAAPQYAQPTSPAGHPHHQPPPPQYQPPQPQPPQYAQPVQTTYQPQYAVAQPAGGQPPPQHAAPMAYPVAPGAYAPPPQHGQHGQHPQYAQPAQSAYPAPPASYGQPQHQHQQGHGWPLGGQP